MTPALLGWASGMAEAFVADPDLSAAYPDWRRIDARGQLLDEVLTQEFDYTVLVRSAFLPGWSWCPLAALPSSRRPCARSGARHLL